MEGDLIRTLAAYGPWGVAGALLVFLRKELFALVRAPRDDRAVEKLLGGIHEQFVLNMKMFEVTNAMLKEIKDELKESNTHQQALIVELVRGKR